MLYFTSDYITGAHPAVLKKLCETNNEPMTGYGEDKYCISAKEKIKKTFACPDAQVVFLTGGTQTNQCVISSVLHSYEGVIAAKTGHVSAHEAGAIEYTGHKVIELDGENGKLSADAGKDYIETFYADGNHTHMVFPGMVYISFPTEYGTLYSENELTELHSVCTEYNIPLYIDGARLAFGLCSKANDIAVDKFASLCDIFYAGGTKCGALCGEAVVFTHSNMPPHMETMIKQRGALLAKGRLNGVQFDALFTDNLYFEIGRQVIEKAERLKNIFFRKGYSFYLDSYTNQQFIILENNRMKELSENVEFSFWEKYDDTHTVVRFATAWSTTDEELDALEAML